MTERVQRLCLLKGESKLFIASGSTVSIFNCQNGTVEAQWPAANADHEDEKNSEDVKAEDAGSQQKNKKNKKGKGNKSNPMVGEILETADGNHLVASFSDKTIRLFSKKLEVLHTWVAHKRPSILVNSPSGTSFLAGDLFGDVHEYDWILREDVKHLLGHLSMILGLCTAERGSQHFVITSDRDEHIRISNYPDTYNINSFCLGHVE